MPFLQQMESAILIWLIPLLIWSAIWKGLALWRAGRNNQLIWFIVMLVVNTAGILEILYYFIFSKRSTQST